MVRMRADQDNTGDVEVTLEEAFRRLDDIELQFARLLTLEGGLEGVTQLIKDVEVLKMRMNEAVANTLPGFAKETDVKI